MYMSSFGLTGVVDKLTTKLIRHRRWSEFLEAFQRRTLSHIIYPVYDVLIELRKQSWIKGLGCISSELPIAIRLGSRLKGNGGADDKVSSLQLCSLGRCESCRSHVSRAVHAATHGYNKRSNSRKSTLSATGMNIWRCGRLLRDSLTEERTKGKDFAFVTVTA